MRAAAAHRVPLHAISRGKNWGYGDARPPKPGQVVVDLSRMNRILEVNVPLGYVRLESGVSQGELFDHLQRNDIPLWMDATGAGRGASVVGNTLDRGFGHTRYGDHFLTACGMKVVLADGRVLETSPRRVPQSKAANVYRYGVGPFIDGLFAQSNFGIVTELTLWLQPRPQAFRAFFILGKRDEDLELIVDKLAPMRLSGLLPSAIHIGNDLRVLAAKVRYPYDRTGGKTPLPSDIRAAMRREQGIGAWNVAGAIYGSPGVVAATARELKRAMRPLRVAFVTDARLALADRACGMLNRLGKGKRLRGLLDSVKPTLALMKGEPNDEPLRAVIWRVKGELPDKPADPLDVNAGLLWVSPILPQRGENARELMSIMTPIYEKHGFEPLVTFTMINERAMVCVSNLSFDVRDAQETAAARACYRELLTVVVGAGYVPYRLGPGSYEAIWEASSDTFRDVALLLKHAFDPSGILSPGRYIPDQT